MAKYLEDKRRRLQGQQTEPVQKQPIQYAPKARSSVQTQSAAPAPAEKQTYTAPKASAEKQNTTPAPTQATTPAQPAGSDVVAQAQQLLGEQLGGYKSQYGSQITDLVAQLQNRPAFEYDVNTDPLYLQLRDIWKQDGFMAMEDAMGQGAQLTGGYGNSHAQMLGQQVYNDHMRGVTEMVPQLREQARADYDAENAELLQRLGLLMDQEEQDYARWMDELNRQRYEEELAYSREQDSYVRQQNAYDRLVELITSTGYVPTAEEMEAAGMTADQAKSWKGYYTSRRTGGGGSNPVNPTGNPVSDDSGGGPVITSPASLLLSLTGNGGLPMKEDYTHVFANCAVFAGNGASAEELISYIEEARRNGSINEAQREKLLEEFGSLPSLSDLDDSKSKENGNGSQRKPVKEPWRQTTWN